MTKEIISGKRVGAAFLCMLALIMPLLNSCGKDSADTHHLLATVPSSAGVVAGINVRSVLEKTGCKVDGSDIVASPELTGWIERQKGVKDSGRQALKLFLDGESGIDPTAAVYFQDAYNSYVTASVADTKKFEEFVSSQTGSQFEETPEGVRHCANVAVKNAQAWVCVSSYNTIDTKAVANYSAQGEGSSFLSNLSSSKIENMTTDIAGWTDLGALTRHGLSLRGMPSLTLIAGMLFEDVSALSFTADFGKGKAVAAVNVLNDKGENAKCLLPMSKIDVDAVKSLAQEAGMIAAINITKDFTKKIEKIGTSLGGNMFKMFTDALKPIDGTVAMACGDINSPDASLSAVVTTDGDPSRELMALLSDLGQTKKEGKTIRVERGEVKGALDVAESAAILKGAMFGFVTDIQSAAGAEGLKSLKTFAMTLSPEGKGLRCDMTLESTAPSENILLTLLKSDAK